MLRPTIRTSLSTVTAVAALTLAGCTEDPATDTTRSPAGTTSSATTSATDSASSQPATSEPATSQPSTTKRSGPPPATTSPTGDPSDSPLARAREALIPKSRFPGFNAQWVWDEASTRRGPGEQPPGVCLQSSLTAIGGVVEYRRSYSSSLSRRDFAVHLSVVFPDEQTATTAVDVLQAWQGRCETHATEADGLKRVSVSSARSVTTKVGTGEQWMVTYRPVPGEPDSVWFNAEGYVRDGDTLTYLVIRSAGQDYNYPAGGEPVDVGLRTAGRYLLNTR